jgi:predicted DNA-binding transcriptional regulator YafY
VAKKGPFAIPTIKGRIAERLQRAESRYEEGDAELEFPDSPGRVVLETAEERGAVALAGLILENFREQGGSKAPKRALERVVRKTLETFDRKEVMELEIEAYEILLWIGSAIDEDWARQEPEEVDEITPASSKLDVIRWAIAGHYDLEMDYYTHSRGEITHRRVTPISLEAETYLHAYCHLRRDDRVFRISRIAELRPVDEHCPWDPDEVESNPPGEPERSPDEQDEEEDNQMSLL